jgi:phosphoglycerate dehydrogenase-like enzyme
MTTNKPFHVGVTSDFLKADGTCGFGNIGLEKLDEAGLNWSYFESPSGVVSTNDAARFDAMLVLGPKVNASTFSNDSILKIVARFGVGYDNIDVPACTANGTILTITPDGVRRPVAVSALTLLLALSHKLLIKDRLTRDGGWSRKLDYNGQGVTGRTMGIIGFGNIGQELAKIAMPLDMNVVAFDPYFSEARGAELAVKSVSLEELLKASDYVVVCCGLIDSTFHLIDAAQLAMMKPNAYLINVARGPIVNQQALTNALARDVIAGAGLDVFETEPVDINDPILQLDNVIVSPHAMCWTDECFETNGRIAIQSIIDVAYGNQPTCIVNREALNHSRWLTQYQPAAQAQGTNISD